MELPECSFAELLARLPDSGAIVTADGTLRSDEIPGFASRAAAALSELGLGRGDQLGVILPNDRAIIAAWFGSAWAGVTFVPINTRLRGDILEYTVSNCEAKLLIVADDVMELVRETCPTVRCIAATDWMALVDSSPEAPMAAASDIGSIIYTSGTTGRPKGVVWHPVTQARHSWFYSREFVPLSPGEVGYTAFPLFHVTSMGVSMGCLLNGATVYIDPRFSASTFWDRMREIRASMFTYLGATAAILLKAPAGPRDREHHLRYGVGGAATPEIWKEFDRRFGISLVEGYGQTELASCWATSPIGSAPAGSVGRFCDRADIRLEPVAEGSDVGLLYVRPRAPHLMMEGYFKDPDATNAMFKDGWYNTRDLIRTDEDGWLYFAGRVSDSIRRRGENISAQEIERVVANHTEILEVAAVGEQSDLTEQEVALYYTRRSDSRIDPRDLAEWCRDHLPDFMVPRYYREIAALPKTATDRVQKGQLHAATLVRAFDAQSGAITEWASVSST